MSNLQQQIGRRIAELRKMRGLSQEELAKQVLISRPSLTQIELGNRSIDIIELHKLSKVLFFSLDDIMSDNFSAAKVSMVNEEQIAWKLEDRIAVPVLQIAKFKNILLYILERCAGKPNVGEAVLHKMLYFCDFNHYELYETHLSGAKYRKQAFGPVPEEMDAVIKQMLDDAQLQRVKTIYRGCPQIRYLPLEKADLTLWKASEKEVIDRVVDQMSDWSAEVISKYAHKDLPWEVTEDGKDVSYELAFYRVLPYSVRSYEIDNA